VNAKFEIFGRADTPETIEAILDSLHYWLSGNKECQPGSTCFVHDKFFMNRETQQVCQCGKSSNVQNMDKNMFSETQFNTNELIRALKFEN
jgi:hypothetical protein